MWRLCMAWSIIIISDLVARAVNRVLASVAGKHVKEGCMAIIRKLILHMCYMQWRSKTCRSCGMESAHPWHGSCLSFDLIRNYGHEYQLIWGSHVAEEKANLSSQV